MLERKLPSYPLFVKDPNFSLWSAGDILNESPVQSWWGEEKSVYGFIKTKGQVYLFLGNYKRLSVPVSLAKQESVTVSLFATEYVFTAGEVTLKARFVSPLPLNDLNLLSLPVCYLSYEVEGDENAEVSLFVGQNVAYNEEDIQGETQMRCGIVPCENFTDALFGLLRQRPFYNYGDLIGADWGYWHLAGERAAIADDEGFASYLGGATPEFLGEGEENYLVASASGARGTLLFGYDEVASINYFGDVRRGYYLEERTIFDALTELRSNLCAVEEKLAAFETDLKARALKFGEDYYEILLASYRQSIASHKLVKDKAGNALFLSKECGSNGCIGTVDVSYPSMPLFLIYNAELVKGMMRPILQFARMPVWRYDFAPHDVGTYPDCCGQVYGLNRNTAVAYDLAYEHWRQKFARYPLYTLPASYDLYNFDHQMPVEECANLLIMFLACYRADGDIAFFKTSADLCAKWVQYLVKYGLKPDNQLCTDDFAGHLKNNVNLAIKATVGIRAYAELLKACGEDGAEYEKIARSFADEIIAFGEEFSHIPLTWDSGEETFSLKYNVAFDKLFGLGLFPQALLEREVDCYLQNANEYGTPLDSRKDYTKSDWLVWASSLTDDMEKCKKMLAPIARFLKQTPDRVPFSDWYETAEGTYHEFRARSVQGGCFILLLK